MSGPTDPKLVAFASSMAASNAPYILPPTSQLAWTTSNGATFYNICGGSAITPVQSISFANASSTLQYTVQNTGLISTGTLGATLYFAAYASSAGQLRVAIAGSSTGTSNSQLVSYTTSLVYYAVPFTAGFNDNSWTITLTGPSSTIVVTDFSMTYNAVGTYLEGNLALQYGTLSAPSINSTTVINAFYIDITNELLTHTEANTYLNGPIYCNGRLYANGGFTGGTGSFNTLSATLLNAGNAKFQVDGSGTTTKQKTPNATCLVTEHRILQRW
jgi:hypothetical protein